MNIIEVEYCEVRNQSQTPILASSHSNMQEEHNYQNIDMNINYEEIISEHEYKTISFNDSIEEEYSEVKHQSQSSILSSNSSMQEDLDHHMKSVMTVLHKLQMSLKDCKTLLI